MASLRSTLRHLLRDAIPAGFYSNAAWQYITSFAGGILTFLYVVVAGAGLGASEFGRMTVALGFVTVVFQFVELRLHEPVIRYVSELRESGDHPRLLAAVKLFLVADFVSGTIAFLIAVVLAPLAARFLLKDAGDASLIVLAAAAILFQNLTTATSIGLYRTFADYRTQALVTALGGIAKVAATWIAISRFGAGVFGVLCVAIVANLVINAVLTANAIRVLFKHVPRTAAPISLLRERLPEMRRFVGATYLLSVSMIPTKELDVNLLGYFTSPSVVGIYKIAKTFLMAIGMLVDPAFFVIYPQLAGMWVRREFAQMRAFLRSITVLFGAASVLICVVAWAVVPWLIVRFAGPQYAASGDVFRWMIFGFIAWAPLVWVNPLLMAADRPGLVTKASLAGSTIVVVAHLALIPAMGAYGAALVLALAPPIVRAFAVWFGVSAGIIPLRETPQGVC